MEKSLKDSAYLKYKQIRNKLSNQIKYAKHNFFASLLDNASPGKRFWGYVKSKSSQTSIPDLVSYKNVSANTPVDIANLFGCFFSECFNRDDVSDTVIPDYNVTSSISHFTCYPTDVIKLIRKLDNNSAAGVDGITSIMLKNTAISVSPLLTHLFNLSISTGSVPSAWKLSRVIPIFKSGDRQSASNYRPISLQPIIGKLLERLIHQNILQHLRINNILTPRQFGFLPQSSTSDALTTALHDWYLTLEKRKDIAVALFDLTKAFDRVPHGPLLLKLRSVGITGPLLSWLRSYLADRTQVVAVQGVASDTVPVISGVPQGSVLGPLLFLIYANDLCFSDFSKDSALVLYADDTTLYKPITCEMDFSDFQKDIDAIHNWFCVNHLTANASKTKAMVISTKKDPYPHMQLLMNNQPIERVSCVKFLGIWISSNLSWNDQIDHICKKARKTIGYLHRSFHSAPPQTRRSLYLALVRPILEYGCTTYHPLNSKLTNRLEATQRFACRVILQDWKLTHDDLLLKADLPLLSKRRDFATLCQLFKIVYKLCSSPNPYNPHPRPGLRNLNSMALDTPFCRLSLTQKSFYPYAPSLWNYLPDSAVKCPTLTAFKSAISQLFC